MKTKRMKKAMLKTLNIFLSLVRCRRGEMPSDSIVMLSLMVVFPSHPDD